MLRTTFYFLFSYFFLLLSSSASAQNPSENILIYIRDDVYEDYQNFLNGRDPTEITNFSGKTIRRDVVDMIIAQQALKLGGFHYKFSYAPGKLNFRNTKMLSAGKLLISFDSYWLTDATALGNDVYVSKPVIRYGEYIAGIYTNPKNKAVLAIQDLADLEQFTSVSTKKWRTDWATLEELPLKELIEEDEWLSMARMVNLGWVDFMLMAFHSTADRSFTMDKVHLVPAPNVGILLKGSRHFVISTKHPLGQEAYIAIEKGLAILREKKRISKAYSQAGFFIDENKIKVINK